MKTEDCKDDVVGYVAWGWKPLVLLSIFISTAIPALFLAAVLSITATAFLSTFPDKDGGALQAAASYRATTATAIFVLSVAAPISFYFVRGFDTLPIFIMVVIVQKIFHYFTGRYMPMPYPANDRATCLGLLMTTSKQPTSGKLCTWEYFFKDHYASKSVEADRPSQGAAEDYDLPESFERVQLPDIKRNTITLFKSRKKPTDE